MTHRTPRPEHSFVPPVPASQAAPQGNSPPPRFRAADVQDHLDMLLIGQTCLGVSLTGYRKLLEAVFAKQSGTLDKLLAALAAGDKETIRTHAHAFKGETISMGLRSLADLAMEIELGAQDFGPDRCSGAAQALGELWLKVASLVRRMGLLA